MTTTTQQARHDAEDDFRRCAVAILALQGGDEYCRAYRLRRRELLATEASAARRAGQVT